MKKKLTALVVLMAFLAMLVPTMAWAADRDIKITVASFDDKQITDQNKYVLVIIDGSDVKAGERVTCYMKGLPTPVYLGSLQNGQNILYIEKENIPGLADPFTSNELTVTVTNETGSVIYKTDTFKKQSQPTEAKQMLVTLTPTKDNNSVPFAISFNSDYIPASGDKVRFTAYDINGKTIGSTNYTYLQYTSFKSEVDGNGMRSLENTQRFSFNSKAVKVRAEFMRDGVVLPALTNELVLGSAYGDFQRLDFEFDSTSVEAGSKVEGKLYYVNKDGKRYDISGDALYVYVDKDSVLTAQNNKRPQFTISPNAKEGSEIKITAYYGNNTVSRTLSVGKAIISQPAAFNRYSGYAGRNIPVEISLTDADDKAKALDFAPTKVEMNWLNSSSSAKVTFLATNLKNLNKNGKMSAIVKSDAAATGSFELIFSDASGHRYVARSAESFKFKDANAKTEKRAVVMSINSKDVLVNGSKHTVDAAPIINSNRTFVPLRALVESFGADVFWDPDTQKITIEYGGKVVEMTVNNKNYSIDGSTKSMDVAPYIQADVNRTQVPVRFVAEALGFSVKPTYNANGTTASVLFGN